MPNTIKNMLKINAPPERVQEILSQIKSDTDSEQLLDFNKIIPMADSLNVTAGSEEELCSLYMTYINPEVDYYGEGHKEENICSVRNEVFLFDKKLNPDQIEKMLTRFNKYSEEQCLQIGKQYYDNYKDFGATSWYHWCIGNWGTKWNACDIYMASEDTIVFYTAWNHPEPIIQKISELFDVNVKLAYANENFNGGNCGFMEYDQGQLQYEWYPDYVDQLAEFSNHVWETDIYVDDFQPDYRLQLIMLC